MRLIPAALAALLLGVPAASAATIPVTTTADELVADETCSLREAVYVANYDVPDSIYGCAGGEGVDTIVLEDATYTLALPGRNEQANETGDLNVIGDGLVIEGNGATIDAAGLDRIFQATVPLTLLDARLVNGDPGVASYDWGAEGGAVLAYGPLHVERSTFEDNQAGDADGSSGSPTYGDPGGGGGAIAATGPLQVSDSVFTGNRSGHGSAAPAPDGYGGSGGSGGAIAYYANGNTGLVERSRFVGNVAGDGGDQGGGDFAGNGGSGSALLAGGDVEVRDSVFTGNATGTAGDGLVLHPGTGTIVAGEGATLRFLTLAGNTAQEGGATGIFVENETDPHPVLSDSIVLGTCSGDLDDGGGNFTPAGSGCPGTVDDPELGDDLVPAPDSPVVDVAECEGRDVRGVERPQGAACDAGALERRLPVLTADPTSLAFPATVVGTTSGPLGVRFTYAGEEPLVAAAPTVSGDFTVAGCGAGLADGDSCTAQVGFAPAATGPRSGALAFGGLEVPLAGTGTPPAIVEEVSVPSITGASLRRRRGKVRLRVKLACKPGFTTCDRTLAVRLRRKGRRTTVKRAFALAAGTRTERFTLKGKLARKLRKGHKVRLRIRLLAPDVPVIERRLTRRVR